MRAATEVIGATPASRSRDRADAGRREDRRPQDRRLADRRDRDRHAQDVGLDPRPGVARRAAAGQPQLADRGAGRGERLGDASASRTPHPRATARASSRAPVRQRQPEERAARLLVEDRRPLARQVRQEHQPAGAGRAPPRPRRTAPPASSRAAEHRLRSQSTDAPSAAIAPPTTHRPGSGAGARNSPSTRRPARSA